MWFLKHCFVVLVVTSFSYSVKVDMQGSISFGKDVLDTISHYMKRNNIIGSRRSMGYTVENDYIYLIVKSSYLCRELSFCEGKLERFLNELITMFTKSVSSVIELLIEEEPTRRQENQIDNHIFENTLRILLRDIKKLLRATNLRISDRTAAFHWVDLIKKIAALYQEAAITFATANLDESTNNNTEIKKKLMQKFVIATVTVESKYVHKLCMEYHLCSNSYECTKALNTLFGAFPTMPGEKVKAFLRYVAEALHDSSFYSYVSEVTANELQVILNDMGFSDTVPTQEVLASIQKTVAVRLNSLKEKTYYVGAKDVELVHIILSDMDHFYARHKPEPFHPFLSSFFDWVRLDTKVRSNIHEAMANIAQNFSEAPEELQVKLIHEVRAFLELTVDPEKRDEGTNENSDKNLV